MILFAEGLARAGRQIAADLPPAVVRVDGLPKDAASAVGRASVNDRSPSGRIQGSEGFVATIRPQNRPCVAWIVDRQ